MNKKINASVGHFEDYSMAFFNLNGRELGLNIHENIIHDVCEIDGVCCERVEIDFTVKENDGKTTYQFECGSYFEIEKMQKTFTLTQFKNLMARDDWKFTEEKESETIEKIKNGGTREYGCAKKIARLGNFVITYYESFQYDSYEKDTFETFENVDIPHWSYSGFQVVDDNHEVFPWHYDWTDYVEAPEIFSKIDYSFDDLDTFIDLTDNSDSEIWELHPLNQPNIKFSGELIDSAESYRNDYERTKYYLFKTTTNKFICAKYIISDDEEYAKIANTINEVKEFFGDELAQELLESA